MKIKGFDRDLKCRGTQFKVGKEYKIELNGRELELCSDTCYHYCNTLEQVHDWYSVSPEVGNRFCEIEVLGDEITDGEKCGSNHIKIIREIVGNELDKLRGTVNENTGVFNKGEHNVGSYNIGDYNTGSRNTGGRNTGNHNTGHLNTGRCNTGGRNTGDYNTGRCNTGRRNTGDYNTGHYNIGDYNTGRYNTGGRNTGDCNQGDYNTGHYNQGDYNSGIFNKCDYSNGIFCDKEPTIKIFNIDSGLTLDEFYHSKYYKAISSSYFPLTTYNASGSGELTNNAFKEACKLWWEDMTYANKKIIKSLPNFDNKIFFNITGIRTNKKRRKQNARI